MYISPFCFNGSIYYESVAREGIFFYVDEINKSNVSSMALLFGDVRGKRNGEAKPWEFKNQKINRRFNRFGAPKKKPITIVINEIKKRFGTNFRKTGQLGTKFKGDVDSSGLAFQRRMSYSSPESNWTGVGIEAKHPLLRENHLQDRPVRSSKEER